MLPTRCCRRGIDHLQPLTLMWSGGLSGPKAVTLGCATPSGSVNVWFVKMNAYRAGTLETVSIAG